MADNTLKGTLTGGENYDETMSMLKPTSTPQMSLPSAPQGSTGGGGSNPEDFRFVMRQIARDAYTERAKTGVESSALAGVDRSKIGGGVFASVMRNLEQMRGGDISKEFAGSMEAYGEMLKQSEKQAVDTEKSTESALNNLRLAQDRYDWYKANGQEVPAYILKTIGINEEGDKMQLSDEELKRRQVMGTKVDTDGTMKRTDWHKYMTDYVKREGAGKSKEEQQQMIKDFGYKYGDLLSEKDREFYDIKNYKGGKKTPQQEEEETLANAIFNGSYDISKVSTVGGKRDRVAILVDDKRKNAAESGDIYGVIRSSAGGDKTSASFRESFEKAANVLYQLADLQENIKGEATGPVTGIWRSNYPYDAKAQSLKAQLTSIVPNLARGIYGEVGVLTDADVELYSRTIPNLRSTEEVNQAILAMTMKSVQRSLENKIKIQAGFNVDMSGIEPFWKELDSKVKTMEAQMEMAAQPQVYEDADSWLASFESNQQNSELNDYLTQYGL